MDRTICGRHDVTGESRRGGWRDRAIVGLEKKVTYENRWFLKAGRVGTDDKWPDNLFQILDAAIEENNFENTIEENLKGTDMVVEAEDRSDREGVYLGRISARLEGCR